MSGLLGVTGTPGTGKKTVSSMLSDRMSIPCFGINDLALQLGFATGRSDSFEVDTRGLGRMLTPSRVPRPSIVYGHLLPYVVARERLSKVAVLRCDPAALKDRLKERSYPPEKIRQNVVAELIGVVSADSIKAYGGRMVWEVDTSRRNPKAVAEELVEIFRMKSTSRPRVDWVSSYSSADGLRSLLGPDSGASFFI